MMWKYFITIFFTKLLEIHYSIIINLLYKWCALKCRVDGVLFLMFGNKAYLLVTFVEISKLIKRYA